jgi:DHA1 family bicyclomycin/chloramphenicol resistance-like MFS transporter
LSDRFGRRPLLLSGLSLFLAGSLIAYIADSVTGLMAGRALQAIGAGCGVTLARTIASDVFGKAGLVKALAYLTMFYTMGPMIAPLFGGILIDAFGWRSVFLFATFVACLILSGAYFVVFETRPDVAAGQSRPPLLRSFVVLLSHPRFAAFVLQSGFSTATFLVMATASSSLLKDLLHRPSSEFGLYFLCFPFGFLFGNFLSSRLSGRVVNEYMVLLGSSVLVITITIQSSLLLLGYVSPLTLFLPGFFTTAAQGLSLPFGQAAAMAVVPRLSGTAAGIGVFMQNFCGAAFAQVYGLVSDGSVGPLMMVTATTTGLCFLAGVTPLLLKLRQQRMTEPVVEP